MRRSTHILVFLLLAIFIAEESYAFGGRAQRRAQHRSRRAPSRDPRIEQAKAMEDQRAKEAAKREQAAEKARQEADKAKKEADAAKAKAAADEKAKGEAEAKAAEAKRLEEEATKKEDESKKDDDQSTEADAAEKILDEIDSKNAKNAEGASEDGGGSQEKGNADQGRLGNDENAKAADRIDEGIKSDTADLGKNPQQPDAAPEVVDLNKVDMKSAADELLGSNNEPKSSSSESGGGEQTTGAEETSPALKDIDKPVATSDEGLEPQKMDVKRETTAENNPGPKEMPEPPEKGPNAEDMLTRKPTEAEFAERLAQNEQKYKETLEKWAKDTGQDKKGFDAAKEAKAKTTDDAAFREKLAKAMEKPDIRAERAQTPEGQPKTDAATEGSKMERQTSKEGPQTPSTKAEVPEGSSNQTAAKTEELKPADTSLTREQADNSRAKAAEAKAKTEQAAKAESETKANPKKATGEKEFVAIGTKNAEEARKAIQESLNHPKVEEALKDLGKKMAENVRSGNEGGDGKAMEKVREAIQPALQDAMAKSGLDSETLQKFLGTKDGLTGHELYMPKEFTDGVAQDLIRKTIDVSPELRSAIADTSAAKAAAKVESMIPGSRIAQFFGRGRIADGRMNAPPGASAGALAGLRGESGYPTVNNSSAYNQASATAYSTAQAKVASLQSSIHTKLTPTINSAVNAGLGLPPNTVKLVTGATHVTGGGQLSPQSYYGYHNPSSRGPVTQSAQYINNPVFKPGVTAQSVAGSIKSMRVPTATTGTTPAAIPASGRKFANTDLLSSVRSMEARLE